MRGSNEVQQQHQQAVDELGLQHRLLGQDEVAQ